MTLKELKTKHGDIILDEVKLEDLDKLACGAVLFYVSLSGKNGPKDDKKVLWAGHAMTVRLNRPYAELTIIRVTDYGNIKYDSIKFDALRDDGRAALFMTRPLTENDPRNKTSWNRWK